jgi:hypothetical protein
MSLASRASEVRAGGGRWCWAGAGRAGQQPGEDEQEGGGRVGQRSGRVAVGGIGVDRARARGRPRIASEAGPGSGRWCQD